MVLIILQVITLLALGGLFLFTEVRVMRQMKRVENLLLSCFTFGKQPAGDVPDNVQVDVRPKKKPKKVVEDDVVPSVDMGEWLYGRDDEEGEL